MGEHKDDKTNRCGETTPRPPSLGLRATGGLRVTDVEPGSKVNVSRHVP